MKLNGKDLINIGLFSSLYIVVFFACGMTGYIPFLMIALPGLIGIFGSVVILLFVQKTPKFGAITLLGLITGLFMFLTGHQVLVVYSGLFCGVLADLVMAKGSYKNSMLLILGCVIFAQWSLGALAPYYFMGESLFKSMELGYGIEYTNVVKSLFSWQMIPVILSISILGSIAGGFLGKYLLRKHFKRAGIV